MSKVVFDENKLTLGDLEDFEDYVGKALHDALKRVPVRDPETNEVVKDDDGRPEMTVNVSMKVLTAMTYISRRHDNPDYTIADARAEKISDLEIVEDTSGDEDAGKEESDS